MECNMLVGQSMYVCMYVWYASLLHHPMALINHAEASCSSSSSTNSKTTAGIVILFVTSKLKKVTESSSQPFP